MNAAAAKLLDLLDLFETGDSSYACAHHNEGGAQIFGGQLMAQALCAAEKTVGEGKAPVSLQSTFIAAGKVSDDVEFRVSVLRDGRAISSRRVDAVQNDQVFFSATILFQSAEQGPEFERPMPNVPTPEQSHELKEMITQYLVLFSDHLPGFDPDASIPPQAIESRFADVAGFFAPNGVESPQQEMWMRFDGELSQDESVQKQILTYVSDQGISHVIGQVLGTGGMNPYVRLLSLDHSIWFYREFRADEWFLMVRRCESFSANRAMVTGEFYDFDGRLIATMTQHTLYRIKAP